MIIVVPVSAGFGWQIIPACVWLFRRPSVRRLLIWTTVWSRWTCCLGDSS